MSQKSGDTDWIRSLEISSGSFGLDWKPYALIRLDCPAEELVDLYTPLDHVEAVLEVVEHLALRRQVGAVLAESPLDVPGGEHGMRLVQPHVRVGVDPHTADAFPPVHQDDFLIAR